MKRRNKKSLSTIIATVFLIVITLIAVSIFYSAVKNLIKSVKLSPKDLCLELTPPISITNVCYNNSRIEIKLRRIDNKQINSLEFVIEFDNRTLVWCCSQDCKCKTCRILTSGSKTYYIPTEEKPKKLSLRIDKCIFETKRVADC